MNLNKNPAAAPVDPPPAQSTRGHRVLSIVCICVLGLCLSQTSVELSLGQEGASLKVNQPITGSAPSPTTTSKSTGDSESDLESESDSQVQMQSTIPSASSQTGTAVGTETTVRTEDDSNASSVLVAQELVSQDSSDSDVESEVQSEVDSNNSMNLESLMTESVSDDSSNQEPVQLSVQPGTQPVLPLDRPAWIGAEPDLSTDVHRLYVGSTAVSDPDDADSALDAPLLAAVRTYTDEQILKEHNASHDLDLSSDFIRKNMVESDSSVVLKLNTGSEPMYQKWVTVEITPEQRSLLHRWHRENVQVERLAPLGLGLVAILGFVGASHLLFRRKHGLATSQPLSSNAFVPVDSPNIGQSRGMGLLGVLGMLFLIGFAGLIAVSFLYVGTRRMEQAEYQKAVQMEAEATARAQQQAAQAEATATSYRSESSVNTSEDSSYGREFVIETGGQKIRVKRFK